MIRKLLPYIILVALLLVACNGLAFLSNVEDLNLENQTVVSQENIENVKETNSIFTPFMGISIFVSFIFGPWLAKVLIKPYILPFFLKD